MSDKVESHDILLSMIAESTRTTAGVLVRVESETGLGTRAVVALESIAESLNHLANATPKPSSLVDIFPTPSPSVRAVKYGTCAKCDRAAAVNSEGWCIECFSTSPVRSV